MNLLVSIHKTRGRVIAHHPFFSHDTQALQFVMRGSPEPFWTIYHVRPSCRSRFNGWLSVSIKTQIRVAAGDPRFCQAVQQIESEVETRRVRCFVASTVRRRRENRKGMSRSKTVRTQNASGLVVEGRGWREEEETRGSTCSAADRTEREGHPTARLGPLMALSFNGYIHTLFYSGCHLSDTPRAIRFTLVLFRLVS